MKPPCRVAGAAFLIRGAAMVLVALTAIASGDANAQASTPLLDEVRTIGRGAEPVERSFEITAAGSHEVVLRDLVSPAALQGVRLAVTRGRQVVATLDAAGSRRFDATAGTHVVRVVPVPTTAAGSGSFGVTVTNVATSARALEFAGVGSLPPPAVPETQRIVDTEFTVSASGTYSVTLADFAMPQALSRATLAITREGAATLSARLDAAGTVAFSASPGVYRVLAVAESPTTVIGGLLGIRVVAQSSGAPVFVQVSPVGRTVAIGNATLASGGHLLVLRDFAFPGALSQRAAIVLREAQLVARTASAGQVPFTAVAGAHQVFAYALAATPPGSGNYEVELRADGGAALVSEVRSAGGGADPTPTFTFPFDVATGGAYQVRLADFEFPAALGTSALALWQAGASPGTLAAPGTLNATLAAGRAYLLVSARPATNGSGLLGVSVVSTAANATPLLETTQAVGALFTVRRIAVTEAGRYDVNVADLGFPANFADLAGVVTRGSTRVGSIFGGGTFGFEATAGDYFVNLVAQPAATGLAGSYGLTVARTPPAPTVSLNASTASVAQGGGVDLTWSSANASACTASGAWTGTRSTTGTERSAALTGSSTFTLECTGAGGRGVASVTVGVTAPAAGGGGGAIGQALLWALWLALAAGRLPDLLPHQARRDALDA